MHELVKMINVIIVVNFVLVLHQVPRITSTFEYPLLIMRRKSYRSLPQN